MCLRSRGVALSGLVLAAALMSFQVESGQAQEPGRTKHVPEADRARPNPLTNDASALAAGQKLYGEKCARCHGATGEGKGH